MPYPPKPPRKYATDEEANAARVQHLLPYRLEPGRSGNLSGMSSEQHQLYREARSLMHRAGPPAIRRLMQLAGIDPEDPDQLVPLEQLDLDPRVIYMASVALCERAYGKAAQAELPKPDDESVIERLMARVAAIRRGEKVVEIEPDDATITALPTPPSPA